MYFLGWHIISRLSDNRVIARTVAERRVYVDAVCRFGEECRVFLFGLPDNHSHVGADCDRAAAGRFAHRLECALRYDLRIDVPFDPVRLIPIEDQRHLENLVNYIPGQARHHGVSVDPCAEGTNLPDLLGLRPLGKFTAEVLRQLAPRTNRTQLLRHLGVDAIPLGTDPAWLRAAAAAVAAVPELVGRAPRVVAARRAAVGAGHEMGLGTGRIADALGISARAVQRLAGEPANGYLVRAIRLQVGLRERVQAVPDVFLDPACDDGRWTPSRRAACDPATTTVAPST